MDEPKVAVLRHYASPYYDPQKAHEYYMRTRELKGRSTTSLNDEGKKIWSYTKNNIKSEKAAKVKEEQEKRDQKITELREKAEATKEQISSRLKELNEALTQNASDRKKNIDTDKDSDLEEIEKESSSQKERIDNKKDAEIERLMAIEIPSGLSKAERSKRVAERTAKIAKLRNDAKSVAMPKRTRLVFERMRQTRKRKYRPIPRKKKLRTRLMLKVKEQKLAPS